MAKSRLLSSSLGKSRKFREVLGIGKHLGEFCQVLYCLLIPTSDDFGRQDGDAFSVKMNVFPSSPRSEAEFDEALDCLTEARLIIRYGDNGQYLQIVNFEEFQTGLHKRTSSKFPEPPEIPGNSGKFLNIPSEQNRTEHELNRTEQKNGAHAPSSFFSLGVNILMASGVTEKNARSFLGKMTKDHGKEAVAIGIAKASLVKDIAEPVAYLTRLIKGEERKAVIPG